LNIHPVAPLPIEVVFHPSWWHHHYGINFGEAFFFDPVTRVNEEQKMRTVLAERFGDLGMGEQNAIPRPVIGPVHLAAGFMPSAVLGCQIRYIDGASPEVIPANLTDEQVAALEVPDLASNAAFQQLVRLIDALEARFGYVEGDVNWEGVQNIAINLRGPQLFVDYYENPALARRLLDVAAETISNMTHYIRARTGTTSTAVNRIVGVFDKPVALHSNCTVAMISPRMYRDFLLPYDQRLAKELWPYGIHHCGNDMHKVRKEYGQVEGAELFDVGWGSDVAACRAALPEAIFSLRLSPVRVGSESVAEVSADVESLLRAAGPLEQSVLCCVNLDENTPDANIREIFAVAERYRR
jgi:hypothetical protein